jgi:hypothetical protein
MRPFVIQDKSCPLGSQTGTTPRLMEPNFTTEHKLLVKLLIRREENYGVSNAYGGTDEVLA